MGKVVYNLLSMQELKRRLKECKLSAQGSRDQLIKRHQEFVLTYNAQCDSLDPKSGEDVWFTACLKLSGVAGGVAVCAGTCAHKAGGAQAKHHNQISQMWI